MLAKSRRKITKSRGQRRSGKQRTLLARGLEIWQNLLPWLKPAGLVATVALAWFGQEQFLDRHLSAGLMFWGLAAVLAAVYFWGQPDRRTQDALPPRVEQMGLAAIAVLALVVRVWRVGTLPNGYFFDEAMNALLGLQMLQDPSYTPVFGPSDAPAPTLFFYFNAVALKFGGISVSATRIMTALMGTATVVMFYFLMRRVVSAPVALASAALLAVMRWHVNFSRINFIGISTPLFGVAAAYFLLRGLETRNRWHMALSGLAVSMGLYTYYASNLVPLVLGPYLALQLVWDREFIKKQWAGVLVFLGVSLLVFAPLGWFALTHQGQFFARNNQVLIFNHVPPEQAGQAFWNNIKTTLLMFQYFGDTNGRHNLPEAPMVDPLSGLLLGLGVIWALTHWHRRHSFLALTWLVVALVPGFLTIEAPQGYRCIGAIVPLAMLIGMGLEQLWQGVRELTQQTSVDRWAWVGLVLLVLPIGVRNLTDYFDKQANHAACWSEFSAREAAIGNSLHELGPEVYAYISASVYNYPTIRFLGYPYLDAEPFQMFRSIPSPYSGEKNLAYMLLPIHDGALELLRFYYPQGEEKVFPSPFSYTLFTSYIVKQAEVNAQRGLQAEYRDALGRTLSRSDGSREFRLVQDGLGLTPPLSVRWQGSIMLPLWSTYRFRLAGAAFARIRMDGVRVKPEGLLLAQGMHRIEMEAAWPADEDEIMLMWQQGEGKTWSTVPGTALSLRPKVHGLTGTFWRTTDWSGEPYNQRVEPQLSLLGADFPLSAPFSARWEGRVQIPADGNYSFGLLCNQFAWLWIDGERIVVNESPDTQQNGAVFLKAGTHDLRVDYQKLEGAYPRLVLTWTLPNKPQENIPFTALEIK